MATSAPVYNAAKKKSWEAAFNLTSDTIKVALVTSSYVPNIDTHDFFDDITNEVTSAGYTAGGAALASPSITIDTSGDFAWFDASDTSWTGTTITARYAIIYKSTGTASTSPLICYIDFGTDWVTSSETFYLQWASTGILKQS